MTKNVAVIGATGAVGREMVVDLQDMLPSRDWNISLFASEKSRGTKIKFHDRELSVDSYQSEKLKNFNYILMSAGGDFSRQESSKLTAQGSFVIDNSSAFRMNDDVALVVPELNGALLKKMNKPQIIANPNCSTIQLVLSLKPLIENFGIEHVVVTTLQSVSGAGQKGIDELENQMKDFHDRKKIEIKKFDHQILLNLLTAIDKIDDAGTAFEEKKIISETKKITGMTDLDIEATTSRVPVLFCHSESVWVKLKKEISLEEALQAFKNEKSLVLESSCDPKKFPTPQQVEKKRDVYISRVRLPLGKKKSNIVQYWNIADNLKVGAATNAVKILKGLMANES